jgi:hypothetical protein
MFTQKQLTTIKKTIREEEQNTASKKEGNIYTHNLILATDRLQEIYKNTCLRDEPKEEEKKHALNSPNLRKSIKHNANEKTKNSSRKRIKRANYNIPRKLSKSPNLKC